MNLIRIFNRYPDQEACIEHLEGVWALLKRAQYGSHHHYTRRFTPLFVAETVWKYNHRADENTFLGFLEAVVA